MIIFTKRDCPLCKQLPKELNPIVWESLLEESTSNARLLDAAELLAAVYWQDKELTFPCGIDPTSGDVINGTQLLMLFGVIPDDCSDGLCTL